MIWDREDGIVRFAHHTVQQFLLHSDQTGKQTGDLQCSHNEAELHVGEMCLTYLLFSDFETQIQVRSAQSRTEQPSDVPQARPAYWIPEMLGVRSSKLELPFRLLGLSPSSSALDIDLGKQLRTASELKRSAPSSEVFKKYSLLQYIIDHWVLHTKGFDHASSLSRKLQDLAMYKSLPFKFRPWGRNRHYGRYGCSSCRPGSSASSNAERLPFMSLLHYAAEVGHWPLMEPLIEDYFSHEVENESRRVLDCQWDEEAKHWLLVESLVSECRHPRKSSDWAICIAIRKGHTAAVERFLAHHNLDGFLSSYATIINAAASCGNIMILGSLLQHLLYRRSTGMFRRYNEEYGPITLALAAANGYKDIVERLCLEGVAVDEKVDKYGETPISAASANGHGEVVRFLMANGVRLLREGVTPLHRAAEYGHATVARTLLELHRDSSVHAGGDRIWKSFDLLGALNRDGETPVHQAARNGHVGVVQVMLEFPSANDEVWLQATTPAHEQTALHLAAANGHLEVVKLLSDKIESSESQGLDGNGESPIMLAVKGNHISVAEWLLPRSNPWSGFEVDNSNRDILTHALIRGYREITQLLVEDHPSRLTCESLVLAAQSRKEEILEFLIDTHRKGGMYVYPDTTKKLIFKASRQAQAEKLPEAARLLKSYYEQET